MATETTDDGSAEAIEQDAQLSRNFLWLTLTIALAVLATDQLTKLWAVAALEGRPPVPIIGSILKFNFVRNPGAAFSLGGGFTIIFSLIAIGVAVVIVRTARTLGSAAWAVALGGLLGGALGNVIDRVLREPSILRGHVVDFIEITHWPVFNVADMAITCSAILMVILTIKGIPLRGRAAGAAKLVPRA
ncbi:MAG: signal peptidase II [Candidatus Nanopelagicales bacterium]